MSRTPDKELFKMLEERYEPINFSHADILRLHAAGALMDGRTATAKIYQKYFSPAAMKLLRDHPEYK